GPEPTSRAGRGALAPGLSVRRASAGKVHATAEQCSHLRLVVDAQRSMPRRSWAVCPRPAEATGADGVSLSSWAIVWCGLRESNPQPRVGGPGHCQYPKPANWRRVQESNPPDPKVSAP